MNNHRVTDAVNTTAAGTEQTLNAGGYNEQLLLFLLFFKLLWYWDIEELLLCINWQS